MSDTNLHQGRPGDSWTRDEGWVSPDGGPSTEEIAAFINQHPGRARQAPPQQPPVEYDDQPVELNLSDKLKQRMGVSTGEIRVTRSERVITMPVKRLLAATGGIVLATGMTSALLDDWAVSKAVDSLLKFQSSATAPAQHGVAEGNDQAPQKQQGQ